MASLADAELSLVHGGKLCARECLFDCANEVRQVELDRGPIKVPQSHWEPIGTSWNAPRVSRPCAPYRNAEIPARVSVQGLDRQRYALTAADAKRDKTAGQAIAPHRVDQLSRQHCTGRPDRMAMGDCAAFNIDDLFWQPKLASDNDGDGGEGFIDFGALNGANIPAGALQGLLNRGHGSQPEHARFDRSDAVRDQACCWKETTLVGPRVVGEHHGRSGVVQSRGIAGGDRAVWTEGRFEPRQCFDRCVGSVVLILVELGWSFFSGHFHWYDLRFEMTIGLRRG